MSKPTAKMHRSLSNAKSVKSRKRRDSNGTSPVGLDLDAILPEGKLYYRIGEVSEITGVKAYVLRYWESEFRWMSPQKSRSKQRLYRRKDIEMILLIRTLLYEERYTIAGARQRLRELGAGKHASTPKGVAATPDPAPEASSHPEQDPEGSHRERFRQIKKELVAIRASL